MNIKQLKLQTTIIFPPMGTDKAEDGYVTDALLAHYDRIASNSEVSLLITEYSYIDKQGKGSPGQLSISRDEDIPGLKQLVDIIHGHDTYAIAQIHHAGAKTTTAITGQTLVGPSSISLKDDVCDALTVDQIHEIVRKFGQAAGRAVEAGYDGVEIHSAHGYFLNQFLSPLSNHRTDAYGSQSLENRMRIHLEVYDEIRRQVGMQVPVCIRFGSDYMEGGTTVEECARAAQIFEEQGMDCIDISGGLCGFILKHDQQPGYFKEVSKAVKKNVSIPVILTGGITTVSQAQTLVDQKYADLIGIGRALYRDANTKGSLKQKM